MVDQPAGESVTLMVRSPWLASRPIQLNQPQSPETTQEQALLQQKLALSNKHTKEAERKAAEAAKQTAALQEQVKVLTEQIQQTNTASLEGQGQI